MLVISLDIIKTGTYSMFQVSDQQVTLEKAGVPGFFVTNKPIEVKVQMYLLDFILRLSRMAIPQVV